MSSHRDDKSYYKNEMKDFVWVHRIRDKKFFIPFKRDQFFWHRIWCFSRRPILEEGKDKLIVVIKKLGDEHISPLPHHTSHGIHIIVIYKKSPISIGKQSGHLRLVTPYYSLGHGYPGVEVLTRDEKCYPK